MSITNISDSVEAALVQARADRLPDLVFRKHPLTSLFKHVKWGGELKKIPVKFAYGAGGSGNFGNAQANQSDDSNVAFLVTLGLDYMIKQVKLTDIEAAQDDGAVIDLLMDRMEGCIKEAGDRLENQLIKSGYNEKGTVGSAAASTVTLSSPSQAINFKPGYKIVAATALNSASLINSGAVGTVLSVDANAGTVTFTQTIAAIWGSLSAGNYLFSQGDKTGAAATMITGLAGWLPLTRPTAGDNWYNVDRSVDVESLAGVYVDGRNMILKVAIETAAARLFPRGGASPDTVACSPIVWNKLAQGLQSFGGANIVDYQGSAGRKAVASFKSIKLTTVCGDLDVLPCPGMDDDKLYVLDSSHWFLSSPSGDIIKNANPNGKTLTVSNADSIEIRERTFGQCYTDAPGFNAVVQIA